MAIKFRKEQLSVKNIGKERFWIGIIAGLLAAFLISMGFNYARELYRAITTISADLLILDDFEFQFYNYFFALLASVLGFSFTACIWMTNTTHKRKIDKIHKQFSRVNILVLFWLILWAVGRFGLTVLFGLHGMPGYDNQLNLEHELWLLFFAILVVIFLNSWFIVRRIYFCGYWIFLSFVGCMVTASLLKMITTVDQQILNEIYLKDFKNDYDYVDKQISKAKNEYGVVFQDKTIRSLKKLYAESSVVQVAKLKLAFSRGDKVSLDSIILQKMVIRNFKLGEQRMSQDPMDVWYYAYPLDVYKQLTFHNIGSNESKELIEILREQIYLVNTPLIKRKDFDKYTMTERRKSFSMKYLLSVQLIEQLSNVRDSINQNENYNTIGLDLPELNYKNKEIF